MWMSEERHSRLVLREGAGLQIVEDEELHLLLLLLLPLLLVSVIADSKQTPPATQVGLLLQRRWIRQGSWRSAVTRQSLPGMQCHMQGCGLIQPLVYDDCRRSVCVRARV